MKVVQFKQFGSPDVLEVFEREKPSFGPSEFLLEVSSAGVNPIDAKIREGSSFVAQSLTLPAGMGYDVCGTIVECGENVTEFQPGDKVMGTVGRHDKPQAYSEYCIGTPSDFAVLPKDGSFNMEELGGLPIAALTAWQGLFDHGGLQKGQTVLILAAAGGVGHLACQFALIKGANVIATASSRHHEFLKTLGVQNIIDYTKTNVNEAVKDVDLVLDLVGGEVGIESFNCLKKEGVMVTVPTITRDQVKKVGVEKGIVTKGMLAETRKEELENFVSLIGDKKLTLKVDSLFSLEEAKNAHKKLEEKHTQGKIVIAPKK